MGKNGRLGHEKTAVRIKSSGFRARRCGGSRRGGIPLASGPRPRWRVLDPVPGGKQPTVVSFVVRAGIDGRVGNEIMGLKDPAVFVAESKLPRTRIPESPKRSRKAWTSA